MNALMNPAGVPLTMTSREIAELTGKDHSNVMRDVRSMVDAISTDSDLNPCAKSTTYTGKDGRQYPQYELDKDTCLTLLLGYDAAARMKVVKRWQELEAVAQTPFAIPQTMAEALRLAADEMERRVQAENSLALAAPKAAAFELVAADTKSLTFTQAAKVLGIKRDEMTKWMAANRWVYRQNGSWVAYQQQIEAGRLTYKEAKYTDDNTGMETYRPYCHVTPKGVTKLAQVFAPGAIDHGLAA